MITKEIFVDFAGVVHVHDGIRVIADKFEKGKHFILLGVGEGLSKISFDRLFPPRVLDVSHPSDMQKNLRVFSVAVKEVFPRQEGKPAFKLLTSLKVTEEDGDDILFRVMMKHPKTPPLIFKCQLSEGTEIVSEGTLRDFDGAVYYERLLILPKGEELQLTTRGGDWSITNHGAGLVQVVQLRKGLGESPLKKALTKNLVEGKSRPAGKAKKAAQSKSELPSPVPSEPVAPESFPQSEMGMTSMDWETEGFGSVFAGQ